MVKVSRIRAFYIDRVWSDNLLFRQRIKFTIKLIYKYSIKNITIPPVKNILRNVFATHDGIPAHERASPVLRVWAHVLGSQRSRNSSSIRPPLLWTLYSRRSCGSLASTLLVHGPLVGPLPISQISPRVSSSRYLLAPSFHRGGSNKSTGFYSCLSDILYSAGPRGLAVRARVCPLLFRPLPSIYLPTRAIRYYKRR